MKPTKASKALVGVLIGLTSTLRPRWGTAVRTHFYRRWGADIPKSPNYISKHVDVDGTDFSLLRIGEGVTISSYVRILTHDWAPHTIGKAFGVLTERPLGRIAGVEIGDFSFVGTGSIIMPGAKIGRGCLIAAGTVVRGTIPDHSVVMGSPGQIVGNTEEYMRRHYPQHMPPARP